jgi:hypothetical protein
LLPSKHGFTLLYAFNFFFNFSLSKFFYEVLSLFVGYTQNVSFPTEDKKPYGRKKTLSYGSFFNKGLDPFLLFTPTPFPTDQFLLFTHKTDVSFGKKTTDVSFGLIFGLFMGLGTKQLLWFIKKKNK